MKHVMVDLETLDTKDSAVVLSIGAVLFDAEKIEKKFYAVIDVDHQLSRGRTISSNTLDWWMKQATAAKQAVFGVKREGVRESLAALSEFIPADACIWGNGATFDNAILCSLYTSFNMSRPWYYRNDRCYRTIRALTKELYPNADIDTEYGVEHNALDDAVAQALTLQKIWLAFRTGGGTE